jgi:two-component system, NtrC family, sensor kinase
MSESASGNTHIDAMAAGDKQRRDVLCHEACWVERKYRAILDQTFEFIALLTPSGTLIEANRTALEFAGVEESEVRGRLFWETPWWTHSQAMQEQLRGAIKAAATGEIVRFEATHPTAGGTAHYIDFSAKPVTNEHGRVVFVIAEGRDITDRKRAEKGMREFIGRFRDMIDNCAQGVLFVEPDVQTILSGNQAMATLLGRSPEELPGMLILDIHPADAHERVRREFEEHRLGRRQHSNEIPVVRKDGSRVYADITSTTVMLNGVRYLSAFFRDVTERKRAENALRESESRLNAVVQGSPIPQFVIDSHHRVTHWNPALEKLSGVKATDVVGTSDHWRAFYPSRRPCLADLLIDGTVERLPEWYAGTCVRSSLVADAYEATGFFPHMGQSGTLLHFTGAPIRDADGRITGAVETLEDVSAKKRADETRQA